MEARLKMVYWQGKRFSVGKLVNHPEILTQGETIEVLADTLTDAHRLMLVEDVPTQQRRRSIP